MKNKRETVDDFLARGGTISIVPPKVVEEERHTVPVRFTINHDSLSLGDGEFMFGEVKTRKKKEVKMTSNEEFNKLLDAYALPSNVRDNLKGNKND